MEQAGNNKDVFAQSSLKSLKDTQKLLFLQVTPVIGALPGGRRSSGTPAHVASDMEPSDPGATHSANMAIHSAVMQCLRNFSKHMK